MDDGRGDGWEAEQEEVELYEEEAGDMDGLGWTETWRQGDSGIDRGCVGSGLDGHCRGLAMEVMRPLSCVSSPLHGRAHGSSVDPVDCFVLFFVIVFVLFLFCVSQLTSSTVYRRGAGSGNSRGKGRTRFRDHNLCLVLVDWESFVTCFSDRSG